MARAPGNLPRFGEATTNCREKRWGPAYRTDVLRGQPLSLRLANQVASDQLEPLRPLCKAFMHGTWCERVAALCLSAAVLCYQ